MVNVIDGDLLEATEDIIGHQVNCSGVMNSGVAKFIRGKYPEIYNPYNIMCGGIVMDKLLGNCQIILCDDGKLVANLFGQGSFGYGKQYTSIEHLRQALQTLKNYAKTHDKTVALPFKIGSCRGGADWNEVYSIIEEEFKDYEVTLYRKDLG